MTDKTQPEAGSAAPAVPNGDELRRIASSARTSASDDASPTEYVLAGWKAAMLAASPTPPAEQQAQPGAVYAELPDFDSSEEPIWEAVFKWRAANPGPDAGKKAMAVESAIIKSLRDFADRTHALRMEQAAPKAAPGEREQAAQRLRDLAGISQDDVADPLHPRYIEGYKAGHAAGRKRAAPQQEAQEPCPSCKNSDIYACTCPFQTSRNTAPQPAPAPLIARSLAEWHEEDGYVAWWVWNGRELAGEPAWIGTPNCEDWPGYHTHWTPHPEQPVFSALATQGGE